MVLFCVLTVVIFSLVISFVLLILLHPDRAVDRGAVTWKSRSSRGENVGLKLSSLRRVLSVLGGADGRRPNRVRGGPGGGRGAGVGGGGEGWFGQGEGEDGGQGKGAGRSVRAKAADAGGGEQGWWTGHDGGNRRRRHSFRMAQSA